jgi:hypothetical protein
MELIDKLPQLEASRCIHAFFGNDDEADHHPLQKFAIWPVLGVRIGALAWHFWQPVPRLAKDPTLPDSAK